MASTLPLVVFSHLRWDFVYQRPQHILTRMAATRRIIVVEEPVFSERPAHWLRSQPDPEITIYRLASPIAESGFSEAHNAEFARLLPELQAQEQLHACLTWLYTPLALPLVQLFQSRGLIYDCMDELSAFAGAAPRIAEYENATFQQAAVVFTGGPSLYDAKQQQHGNVYCFPSSVDVAHFAQARSALPEPDDQTALPHPRLGFFGVIDERFDAALIGAIAAAHPTWQIVVIGPIVKIDPAQLPQAPNIHYPGQRSYQELPAYLSGWDVCLLPFAHNAATRFISPTKTLEYMAAEKPVVSTAIHDVSTLYGSGVRIAETHADFIRQCEAALAESPAQREERSAHMRRLVAQTSWDRTVQAMQAAINDAIFQRSITPAYHIPDTLLEAEYPR